MDLARADIETTLAARDVAHPPPVGLFDESETVCLELMAHYWGSFEDNRDYKEWLAREKFGQDKGKEVHKVARSSWRNPFSRGGGSAQLPASDTSAKGESEPPNQPLPTSRDTWLKLSYLLQPKLGTDERGVGSNRPWTSDELVLAWSVQPSCPKVSMHRPLRLSLTALRGCCS